MTTFVALVSSAAVALGVGGCSDHDTALAAPSSTTTTPIPHTGLTSADLAKFLHVAESDPRLGVQTAISYHGKVVFQHGYGKADIAAHRTMTPTTPVGIGSITKQFTAAEIMQLVEQHKLKLSDTLTTLLPEEHWPAHITVRELLQHTSGLSTREYRVSSSNAQQTERNIEDHIAESKPVSRPGDKYAYNNNGYYLLGLIIQRVTHRSWSEVTASLVRPVWPHADAQSVICQGATVHKEAKAYGSDLSNGPQPVYAYPAILSDGAMCATATQLLRWQRALRTGKVVSASSYKMMTTPSKASIAAGTPYGMGLAVGKGGLISHDGLMPLKTDHGGFGYGSTLIYQPKRHIGIAVLCTHGVKVPDAVVDRVIEGDETSK